MLFVWLRFVCHQDKHSAPEVCVLEPRPWCKPNQCFTLSWTEGLKYAFPPFSIIERALKKKKIREDKATLLVILPLWPTQTWFPRALQVLVAEPILLPRECAFLPQDPALPHPLSSKLRLAAMINQEIFWKLVKFAGSYVVSTWIMEKWHKTTKWASNH